MDPRLDAGASSAARCATEQYAAGTENLDRRVAIHAYGVNPQSWTRFVREHLPLEQCSRVLDVGAGTGVHWTDPAPGVEVVVTDLHWPMCRTLQQGPAGRALAQCHAEALPFSSHSFDGVMSMHVLYHVPRPRDAVAEMLRVAERTGWVAVATNGPLHMRELKQVAELAGSPSLPALHHLRFTVDHAEELLRSFGLQPSRHQYVDELVVPPGPVLDYLDSLGSPLAVDARDRVLAAISDGADDAGRMRISKDTALLVARLP